LFGGDQAFTHTAAVAFCGQAGQLAYVQAKALLVADMNADFTLELVNRPAVLAAGLIPPCGDLYGCASPPTASGVACQCMRTGRKCC